MDKQRLETLRQRARHFVWLRPADALELCEEIDRLNVKCDRVCGTSLKVADLNFKVLEEARRLHASRKVANDNAQAADAVLADVRAAIGCPVGRDIVAFAREIAEQASWGGDVRVVPADATLQAITITPQCCQSLASGSAARTTACDAPPEPDAVVDETDLADGDAIADDIFGAVEATEDALSSVLAVIGQCKEEDMLARQKLTAALTLLDEAAGFYAKAA